MRDAGCGGQGRNNIFAVPPTLVLPLPMHSHVRRTVLAGVKFALAAGILAYLLVTGRDAIAKMSERTIEWPLLGAALRLYARDGNAQLRALAFVDSRRGDRRTACRFAAAWRWASR